MGNTNQLDKAPPQARPDDRSHYGDAQAVAASQSPAQSEAMALMKAGSQGKSAPVDSGAGAVTGDSQSAKKSEPSHLEFTPLKELANPGQASPAGDVKQAHEQLMASATKNFGSDTAGLGKFEANMNTFEERMKSASPDDVAKTYEQVKRLLDTPSSIVSDEQRKDIAGDVMDRAAHPLASNQGNSNDCAAASIENLLYSRSPALAASYVADVALTGKFTDKQGNVVSIDKDSIAEHDTSLSDKQQRTGSETRSHGDQIMQVAIRNEEMALLNKQNGISSDGNHGLKYQLRDATLQDPTGETVIDYSKKPPQDVSDQYEWGMNSATIPDVAAALDPKNGKAADNLMLSAFSVRNVDQFKAALANPEPPYPRMIAVNEAQEPFASTMGEDSSVGHAITIQSYDATTNQIHYRNSKFGSRDMTTDANTMYNAMLSSAGDGLIFDGASTVKENHKEFVNKTDDAKAWTVHLLQAIEVDKRATIMQGISKKSGIDLSKLLTDQEKRELGIGN